MFFGVRLLLRVCCSTLLLALVAVGSAASAQQTANPFESVDNGGVWTVGDPTSDRTATPMVAPEEPTGLPDNSSIMIGSVNVETSLQIPADILAGSYEQFIGQEATRDVLQQLASAVSASAREQGYIFASAKIPSQSVKIGMVAVELDPGAIDEVRIIGSQNKRLQRILGGLKSNAARSDMVQRQLLLAGDLPDISLVSSSYLREDGRGVLVVSVNEIQAKGYAALDNHGPDTLGPIRARLSLDIAGLLTDGDVFSTTVISSALQPRELTHINARYAMTLGHGDTVIGFAGAAGRTSSGGALRQFNFEGRNRYAAIFASQTLKRSNDFNLWLNAELAYLDVQQTQSDRLFQQDEIITASLNFTGNYNVGVGRIYGGVGVTQGLGILGASQSGDPLNSRLNGSGSFTKANFWINSILNMGRGFGVRLAGNAQIASQPLLSANEIAIGGPYFGRGYDFSERFGDEGILGLAELRKEFKAVNGWLDWFQLYGFIDGGHVSNIGTGFGDGSLISAGGGLRAQIGAVDLNVETAAPIDENRFESGDRSPKINFQLGVRF